MHPKKNPRPTPAQPASANAPAQMLRLFMERHQAAILAGSIALLLALTALYIGKRREAIAFRASESLGRARSAEEFEAVAEDFRRTPAAPPAILQAARMHFEAGSFRKAAEHYEAFLESHPRHPLAPVAVLGNLHCQEALGDLDRALRGFEDFLREYPDHYLRPQAVMGKARCLESAGRLEDARIVYEDFIALNPGNHWTPSVEQALMNVNRRLRAEQSAP